MWWQSYSRYFTIQTPGWECLLWPCGDVGEWLVQINCPSVVSEVQKTSTVQLSLWEAVSQGQWMHPIFSLPFYIWFNRERRGPQTELWERIQQQCGQVVNTQTWRGRAGLQTGLISPGLSRLADRGGGERGGGGRVVIWAPFIHSSPVNYLSLAGSVVIWAVRIQLKVRHWKEHYNEAGDRQTGRQMHLEAEVSESSWDPPIC